MCLVNNWKVNESGTGRLLWCQDTVWFPLGFSLRFWSPPRLKYYVSKTPVSPFGSRTPQCSDHPSTLSPDLICLPSTSHSSLGANGC